MACAIAPPQAQMPPHSAADGVTAATAEMVPGDVVPTVMQQPSGINNSRAELERLALDFDRGYFAGGVREGPGGGTYLPSTFYMTAYRRIGADLMR
jgi:hypothetical protein